MANVRNSRDAKTNLGGAEGPGGDVLREARKRMATAVSYEETNRNAARDDIQMLTGDQWELDSKSNRQTMGRPALTINHLQSFVSQVVADQRKDRISIKVKSKKGAGDTVASVFEGLIRHIQNESNAVDAYNHGFDCALQGGFGYWRVVTEYESDHSFDQVIRIKPVVNPFGVFFDPKYSDLDKTEAGWALVIEEMSKDEYRERYGKDAAPESFEPAGKDLFGSLSPDKVRLAEYYRRKRKVETIVRLSDGAVYPEEEGLKVVSASESFHAQLMEQYQKTVEAWREMQDQMAQNPPGQGPQAPAMPPMPPPPPDPVSVLASREVETWEVEQYVLNGIEVLSGPNRIPGEIIPIVPVYGIETWVDGKRRLASLIRYAKDSQRQYNFWRTTATEIMSIIPKSPYLVTPEQIEGLEDVWKNANSYNQPYLLYNAVNGQPIPQRAQPIQVNPGVMAEASQALMDMRSTVGIHSAELGMPGNETSGVAISNRQRQSDNAVFIFTDNLMRAVRQTGRILVGMIPEIYDTRREVTLMDDAETERMVIVNGETFDAAGNVVPLNALTSGDYDVAVAAGPSMMTAQDEAAAGMVEFLHVYPQAGPVIADLIAETQDWPKAKVIAERLRKTIPPYILDPNAPPPQANPQMQLQMEKIRTQREKLGVETHKANVELAKSLEKQSTLSGSIHEQVRESIAEVLSHLLATIGTAR